VFDFFFFILITALPAPMAGSVKKLEKPVAAPFRSPVVRQGKLGRR